MHGQGNQGIVRRRTQSYTAQAIQKIDAACHAVALAKAEDCGKGLFPDWKLAALSKPTKMTRHTAFFKTDRLPAIRAHFTP